MVQFVNNIFKYIFLNGNYIYWFTFIDLLLRANWQYVSSDTSNHIVLIRQMSITWTNVAEFI